MLPLHRKDINGLECQKLRNSPVGTELPRFHGIKRYFKNSLNSPWMQILCRFPEIAPKYRIFHWITSFYNIYHTIARLYSIYNDNGVIPVIPWKITVLPHGIAPTVLPQVTLLQNIIIIDTKKSKDLVLLLFD